MERCGDTGYLGTCRVVTARSTGLAKDSVANSSQILSLDRTRLEARAGRLTPRWLHLGLGGLDVVLDR
jgi:mRNA interferase MazF